ncbi:hypothetical protein [Desulfosporosinus sp. FKB]|uniref:hypothetical protein n=1 Tax=Desulfosporosinus sp. FKB TaxID=1969835 RepID=UPI001FA9050E|nr:hypothetical protein [Desulfosporosinus sp. FKB]
MSSTVCALAIAVQAGIPVLTWGPPGVGKTASITKLADVLGIPLEVVLASIREPSDFSGLPVIGKAFWQKNTMLFWRNRNSCH